MADDNTKTLSADDAVQSIVDEQLTDDPSLVSDDVDQEAAESDKLAVQLSSLQQLIERGAEQLDKLKDAQKQLRESLKNVFENDAQLNEAEEKAVQIQSEVKDRKAQLDASAEVRQLKMKLADIKEDMKDLEESLNNHLINLFQLTGTNSFDTSDGDQREFVLKARIKPKKAR